MRVVNIKEHNPNFEYAIYVLDVAIRDAIKMGENGLIVIHGYGSHGRGGDIKRASLQYLKHAKDIGLIKNYVVGEQWSDINPIVCDAINKNPELLLQQNLNLLNSGVSVVLLS